MPLSLVDKIIKPPATCGICTTTPTDVDGNVLPMIDAEVDVNFGDELYICSECVGIMARLFGYVEPKVVQGVRQEREELFEKVEDLKTELDEANERIETLVRAKAAIKAVKERRMEREEEAA